MHRSRDTHQAEGKHHAPKGRRQGQFRQRQGRVVGLAPSSHVEQRESWVVRGAVVTEDRGSKEHPRGTTIAGGIEHGQLFLELRTGEGLQVRVGQAGGEFFMASSEDRQASHATTTPLQRQESEEAARPDSMARRDVLRPSEEAKTACTGRAREQGRGDARRHAAFSGGLVAVNQTRGHGMQGRRSTRRQRAHELSMIQQSADPITRRTQAPPHSRQA